MAHHATVEPKKDVKQSLAAVSHNRKKKVEQPETVFTPPQPEPQAPPQPACAEKHKIQKLMKKPKRKSVLSSKLRKQYKFMPKQNSKEENERIMRDLASIDKIRDS